AKGALVSYGVSYSEFGRFSAKHVQRVLLGADPGDVPVEQVDRLYLAINLKTAQALGLTIPPSVLSRADQVIEQCPAPPALASGPASSAPRCASPWRRGGSRRAADP